jgi:hypothetical protein
VDLNVFLVGCVVGILSHYCVYKLGKYQGWRDAFRQDARYRYGKAGMALREGETFFGVVDAKKGPCFFVAHARRDVDAE